MVTRDGNTRQSGHVVLATTCPSGVAHVGEATYGETDAKELEKKVRKHPDEKGRLGGSAVRFHLCLDVLRTHPIEKQWVRGLDVILGLGLLHGKPEEIALLVFHHTEPCRCAWM